MSFRLFSPPTIARIGLGMGLGVSAAALSPLSPFRASPLRCDYGPPQPQSSEPDWLIKDPLVQKQGRSGIAAQAKAAFLTPENMKEISLGSVLGLVAGVGLRAFSRVLVVLLGMGVVLVEYAASKGYNIIPVERIQKYVKNADVRRALSRHRPFKASFGTMMALAAFAQF
ncbi:hypothetical protein N7468_003528 [Penicillium chermesinum]|uniref:FUN14 n=1 Tax=Penicillium chermesinum TaxID=63820 RepID=A0A9W9P6K0_9EURO|nr:uncharacterized protein N7468_003528 [Penicillium chermesinum]KAJ5238909.1 hypothetical protein N7468_003528 [Penicillium chermesinum]